MFPKVVTRSLEAKTDMIVNAVQTASSLVSFQVVLRSLWSQPVCRISLGFGFQDLQLNKNAASVIQALQACLTRAVHGYSFVMASLGLCALHAILGPLFHCNFEDVHTGRGSREQRAGGF